MQGILNWKKCVECGEPFDIGTNYNICPDCRIDIVEDEEEVSWS